MFKNDKTFREQPGSQNQLETGLRSQKAKTVKTCLFQTSHLIKINYAAFCFTETVPKEQRGTWEMRQGV